MEERPRLSEARKAAKAQLIRGSLQAEETFRPVLGLRKESMLAVELAREPLVTQEGVAAAAESEALLELMCKVECIEDESGV